MTYDERNVYVGTTSGRLVAVPLENLRQRADSEPEVLPTDSLATHQSPWHQQDEVDGVYMDQSAVALHSQRDNKVKALLHIPIPAASVDPQEPLPFNSLPILGGHLPKMSGAGMGLGHPPYQSLLVSAGKGHTEYTSTSEEEEDETAAARIRARDKSFQLLVWGHK